MGAVSLLPIQAPSGGAKSLLPQQQRGSQSLLPKPNGAHSLAPSEHSAAVSTMQNLLMGLGETISDHRGFNAFLRSHYGTNVDPMVLLSVGKPETIAGHESWRADGVWGQHTDIGLREALKLGEAIEKAHTDLNLAGEPFIAEQFKELIPPSFEQASSEIADKISGELDALKQHYIETTYKIVSQHTDNKEDFYAKTHGNDVVMTLPGEIPLHLSDLTSGQTLMAVLQRAYPNETVDIKAKAKELLSQLGVAPGGIAI